MSSAHSAHTMAINVLSNFSNSRSPEEFQVDSGTTAADLVQRVLARHSMLSKDPHLLYVTLDTMGPRGFSESTELQDNARLLQRLQVAQQRSRERQTSAGSPAMRHLFVMHMRTGGLLKIHDSCIMPGSFYNSLYVSMETTAEQVIALLLASYGSREAPAGFRLVAKKDSGGSSARNELKQRPLDSCECPLAVQQQQHMGIHLQRAADTEAASKQQPAQLTRSETLAQLQASFRDLQRLREQNPALYDRLLVAPEPPEEKAAAPSATTAAGGFQSDRGVPSKHRHSARLSLQRGSGGGGTGYLSARTVGSGSGATATTAKATAAGEASYEGDDDTAAESFRARQLAGNRSVRSDRLPTTAHQPPQQPQKPRPSLAESPAAVERRSGHRQLQQQQQQQQQSKRQLPQLPTDAELTARRLKQEARPAGQRDFQCQAFEEAGPLGRQRTGPQYQPSLREVLAACQATGCQLVRGSRGHLWGVRWHEVQFGDVNGNHQEPAGHRKPAIGRRQGAFLRNERLLKYMRTLVAVQSVDEGGAAATSGGDLRPGDLVLEVNGCLATGMAPDDIESLAESQLTLDLLVARQRSEPETAETSSDLLAVEDNDDDNSNKDAGELRLQLRQLQLRCNELTGQARLNEQVIQRLRSQLTKRAKVCVLQHTEQSRPKSHAESDRSFQVIRAAAGAASNDSPVTSAV